jgi:hypothetical protein
MCVQERVVCALRGYFLSHGIYVSEANLGDGTRRARCAKDHHAYYRSDFR